MLNLFFCFLNVLSYQLANFNYTLIYILPPGFINIQSITLMNVKMRCVNENALRSEVGRRSSVNTQLNHVQRLNNWMDHFYAVVSSLMGDFSQTLILVRFTVIQTRKCNKVNNLFFYKL